MGRNHSPIPPPREPRRDPERVYADPYERRGAPPPRDAYANPPRERRRQRSISPYRRGSPPPRPKRYRPGDEDYYDTGRFDRSPRGRRGGPQYDGYDDSPHGYGGGEFDGRGPPPPPPGRPKRDGPLTFKDFMLQRVEDDPSPEEAQHRYQEYLIEFHGSMLKAEFAARKDQRDVRKQFDAREAEKAAAVRHDEAAAAAAVLAVDISEGKYDPSSETFNQGTLDAAAPAAAAEEGAEGAAAGAAGVAGSIEGSKPSPLLWKTERVAADVKLARRLMAALDGEKGISVNPLLAALREKAEAAVAAQKEAAAAGGDGAGAAGGDVAAEGGAMEGQEGAGAAAGAEAGAGGTAAEGAAAAANGETAAEPMATDAAATVAAPAAAAGTTAVKAAAPAAEQDPAAALAAAMEAAIEAEGPEAEALAADAAAFAAALGQLDLALTWLWRVHGVDYYGGREVTDADEFAERLGKVRTLRGPQPEEGEEQDAAESKKDADALAKSVDQRWAERIKAGDPVLKKCQREKVEELLEKWVQDQVIKHDEHKWGSTVSAKLFMEERFVLKHIRNKHENKVEEARQAILDDLYWEAFRAAHEEEEKEHQRAGGHGPGRQNSGFGGRGGNRAYNGGGGEYYDDGGYGDGGWDGGYGGRGRGSGRGGRGNRRGPGGGMMLDGAGPMGMGMGLNPAAMMAGMGMGGPIFIPIAGAGPMGPILGAPQALGGMMGTPMEMDPSALLGGLMGGGRGGRGGMMMMQGGRGGRGGPGGRGGGGFGGRGPSMGPGGREYYDLDNPRHNRAVLDYSDL